MNDDFDLTRLGEIGDPFAADASQPARPAPPVAKTASPTRARTRALRAGALVAAVLFDAAWLVFRETRPDLGSLPASAIALGLVIPLVASTLALAAGSRTGTRGLGLPAPRVRALAVAAPALFAVATALAAPAGPGDRLFWVHAAGCATVTAILAVGPLALGLWAYRRAFVGAAAWRAAAIGVAAGGLAAATMSLACPISSASHVILGHGAVMLVTALAGALLAPALART
jgi:hypothetical protein